MVRAPDGAGAIAAGDAGVWVISGVNTISRIDPRTNRMRKAIELGSNRLFGIAVGGGAVWATSEEGVLWRVEPGQPPIERTIEVGAGVRYVAFGDGAVWVANWNDSTVSRVDPATNQVAARVPVGAAQALAAGAGSAWVSVAGGSRSGVLPASACGELVAGGGRPDVLIASNLTLRGPSDVVTPTMVDAIRFVLQDHGFRAGEHTVGYRSCDDSTAQSGGVEFRRCAANANAFAAADRLVAVIGPFYSFCAQIMIPILNRAARRAAGTGRADDDVAEPHARRAVRAAGAVRLPRRARRLLPDRRTQLRAPGRQRRPPGRGARAAREIARAAERLSDQRR